MFAELTAGRWDAGGLSSVASGLPEAVEIAREMPGVPKAIGGQATLWQGLDDLDLFEWIVEGEGESALGNLSSAARGGAGTAAAARTGVSRGIARRSTSLRRWRTRFSGTRTPGGCTLWTTCLRPCRTVSTGYMTCG